MQGGCKERKLKAEERLSGERHFYSDDLRSCCQPWWPMSISVTHMVEGKPFTQRWRGWESIQPHGNSTAIPAKSRTELPYDSWIPMLGTRPKELTWSDILRAYCSILYNNRDRESFVLADRRVCRQTVTYVPNGTLFRQEDYILSL